MNIYPSAKADCVYKLQFSNKINNFLFWKCFSFGRSNVRPKKGFDRPGSGE